MRYVALIRFLQVASPTLRTHAQKRHLSSEKHFTTFHYDKHVKSPSFELDFLSSETAFFGLLESLDKFTLSPGPGPQ